MRPCGEFAFGKLDGIRLFKSLDKSCLPCHRYGGGGQERSDVGSRAFCCRQAKPSFEVLAQGQDGKGLNFLGATVIPSFLVFQSFRTRRATTCGSSGVAGATEVGSALRCGLCFHKKRASSTSPRRPRHATHIGHVRCRRSQRLHSTATMSAGGMGWASSANTGVSTRMSRGDVSWGPKTQAASPQTPNPSLSGSTFSGARCLVQIPQGLQGVDGRGRENFQTC